jgi:nitroreductase
VSIEEDKIADTLPGVHDLIRRRWSPRAFSSREISHDDLKILLDAARWAASSSNEQPWRFLVGRKSDEKAHSQMLNVLVPANQGWAKNAPVLILMAAKKTFSQNNATNRYAMHDTGAALAHLFLQATALGLHAHGMAGLDPDKARTAFGIPDDYEVAAAVALGYLGALEELPEGLQARELAARTRKPLSEIAFGSHWNRALEA